MGAILERIGVELPVVQAGMGGGIAAHGLAAAVSEAGGLGTIGTVPAPALREEIARARELTRRPLAVNLLLPFARAAHWRAAAAADVVVTFWGRPRRRSSGSWIHQCGTVDEALAARAAGADAVIAQGVEAGGHVRGTTPAMELLERMRAALPRDYPILLAGGIADGHDVREALDAGAEAVVLGTRFVLSEESGADPDYRRRLVAARETLLTELFGLGWPAPHRVVSNSATERWLGADARGPRLVRALNRLTAPVAARAPGALQARLMAAQRPAVPLFSPAPPSTGAPDSLLEAGPLYAGESVGRISDVRPAAELTRELAP
jgi:nitronate monooxygenase